LGKGIHSINQLQAINRTLRRIGGRFSILTIACVAVPVPQSTSAPARHKHNAPSFDLNLRTVTSTSQHHCTPRTDIPPRSMPIPSFVHRSHTTSLLMRHHKAFTQHTSAHPYCTTKTPHVILMPWKIPQTRQRPPKQDSSQREEQGDISVGRSQSPPCDLAGSAMWRERKAAFVRKVG
jgi:hypothetical protein